MTTFKMVNIDAIESNSNRNFKLYPIAKAQVNSLVESYTETGDFGVIPVRPIGNGWYEQAAGHHRLAALKKMGHTEVQCVVNNYDEDEMIRIMVLENSSQQGNNAPAALDSLSAVTYQVAYYLLLSDTVEDFAELAGAPADSFGRKFKSVKAGIENGEPIPFVYLKSYAHEGLAGVSQVKELNATLQASGELGRIYKRVVKRVTEETAAQEAEELAAEASRKRAEAKAAREQKAAEAAAEAAAKALVKAKASQKKALEARQIENARQEKIKAKLRIEEAAKRAKEREIADAARKEREERTRSAMAAQRAAEAKAKEMGLNVKVLHMLKAQRHQEAFRRMVTSTEGKKVFPFSQQPALVQEMIDAHSLEELSEAKIKNFLADRLAEHSAVISDMLRQQKEREEKGSVTRKVHNAIDAFRAAFVGTDRALMKLVDVLDDDKTGEYAFREIATDQKLSDAIDRLETIILRLRKTLTLRQSHYQYSVVNSKNEKAVN